VSLKTLFYELVFSAILTLYVYEHNSSKMVIGFSLLDMGVTLWKISRTFSLKMGGGFPWVRL
jgi:multisubunit Na+/H+ antiporter MnhC subunit